MRTIDKTSPIPAYYQLKEILKKQILNNYKNGDTFLTQRALSQKFNLAYVTVGRALSDLVNEGLLHRIQGKGTFVTESLSSSGKKSHVIGLAIAERESLLSSNPFYFEVLRGIKKIADESDYDILLFASSHEEISHSFVKIKEKSADGIVLICKWFDEILYKKIQELNIPFVTIGKCSSTQTGNYISINNFRAAKLLVEHLVSLGHTRIAFITDTLYSPSRQDMLAGYKSVLSNADLDYSDDRMIVSIEGEASQKTGYKAMQKLLDDSSSLTAVFTINVPMAAGALKAIKERNLRVPEDIAVVSNYDIPLAIVNTPPITAVSVSDFFEFGLEAAKMIFNAITQGKINQAPITLSTKPELIIRESTYVARRP